MAWLLVTCAQNYLQIIMRNIYFLSLNELFIKGLTNGSDKNDGVGSGFLEVQGEVEVLVQEAVVVLGGSGVLVSFVFVVGSESVSLGFEIRRLLLRLTAGSDWVEFLVFLAKSPGPWVTDDGGVWQLVV